MHNTRFTTLLIAIALLSACVAAPPHTSGRVVVADEQGYVELRFSDRDRAYIRDYYRHHRQGLPPGLAKKDKLPPGHARKLERHQPLPPGLSYHGLPQDLDDRLPRLPAGYVRVRVERDIILMDRKTRLILDIIQDID